MDGDDMAAYAKSNPDSVAVEQWIREGKIEFRRIIGGPLDGEIDCYKKSAIWQRYTDEDTGVVYIYELDDKDSKRMRFLRTEDEE